MLIAEVTALTDAVTLRDTLTTVAVLAGVGMALLVLESFFPTAVAGAMGLLFFVLAISDAVAYLGRQAGLYVLMGEVLIIALWFFIWMKFFPGSHIGKKFALSLRPQQMSTTELHTDLIGKTGRTLTPLRPSGTALVMGKRLDVVTEGQFIEQDEAICVTSVTGARIVVESTSIV